MSFQSFLMKCTLLVSPITLQFFNVSLEYMQVKQAEWSKNAEFECLKSHFFITGCK